MAAQGFPGGSDGKESACNAGDLGLIPESRRSLGEEWQPTPVFLPGEFHGQRNPVSYSPWGRKELVMTEQLTHTQSKLHASKSPFREDKRIKKKTVF